jgi:hypothetical protein
MWNPSTRDLETVADMALMPHDRIAAAVGIPIEVFSRWLSRLAAARALDDQAVDALLYPPRPRPVAAPPPPRHDPQIIAERIFEKISECV